ncbi:hypothetical protein V6N13_074255 [Hibiscus sabdariffa]
MVLKGRNDSQFAQDARLVATAEGGDNNLSGRDLPAREGGDNNLSGCELLACEGQSSSHADASDVAPELVPLVDNVDNASNGDVYAPNEDVQVSDDGVIGHF